MRTKQVNVQMTYNLGNYESKKVEVLVEATNENETTEHLYHEAACKLARLISGGEPDAEEYVLDKFHICLLPGEIQDLKDEYEAKVQLVRKLKKEIEEIDNWVGLFYQQKEKMNALTEIFEAASATSSYIDLMNKFTDFAAKKMEEVEAEDEVSDAEIAEAMGVMIEHGVIGNIPSDEF